VDCVHASASLQYTEDSHRKGAQRVGGERGSSPAVKRAATVVVRTRRPVSRGGRSDSWGCGACMRCSRVGRT
jgi:hypothetical protein